MYEWVVIKTIYRCTVHAFVYSGYYLGDETMYRVLQFGGCHIDEYEHSFYTVSEEYQ
jgi:hypothetical protein